MKLRTLIATLAVVLATATPGPAELCTVDVVPAQTLLLPYFQVDLTKLSKPRKAEVTTLHVSNLTVPEQRIVLIVTVWTDLAVPTVSWEIPLAEWASIDIPVHEIFQGRFPGIEPAVDPAGLGLDPASLRAAHSGKPVELWSGDCASQDLGDKYARGYVTIDVLGEGIVFGEVSYLSQKSKYAQTASLVHIEKSGGTAEPLGSSWVVRYSRASKDQTWLVVWRDTEGGRRFACGEPEAIDWYPLGHDQIVAFGADGDLEELDRDVPLFPAATGIYRVDAGDLSVPDERGWIFLGLGLQGSVNGTYVESLQYLGSGRRRGRNQALMRTSACDP